MPRPRTRWFCRWKPRRTDPRFVNARSAARFVCKALDYGATDSEIELEIERICPELNNRLRTRARPIPGPDKLAEASSALEISNSQIERAGRILRISTRILDGIALLGRTVPQLRILRIAAAAARARIEPVIIEGQAVRVANDTIIREIRQLENIRRTLQ